MARLAEREGATIEGKMDDNGESEERLHNGNLQIGQAIAQLPCRFGGLGLRCADRTSEAAYWASWADALHMMTQRNPIACAKIIEVLRSNERSRDDCIGEVIRAREVLVNENWDYYAAAHLLSLGTKFP